MAEVTISKNSVSVTIYAREVVDNLNNNIFSIKVPQAKQNQSSGPKSTKIIDLLRITREFLISGVITATASKTAKQVKDDLYNIAEGAGADGGVVTLVYDGDSIDGIIEKVTAKEEPSDAPSPEPEDFAKYDVQINFLKGGII